MSGTSLDGVDGVLAAISDASLAVVACASSSFEADFRTELLALNSASHDELHRAALAGNRIANRYADVVGQLLQQAQNQGIAAAQVRAIGAHGQTVRHQPQLHDGTGYTLQLANPSLLAALTAIDVVADFRSRDVAAGGQGAPLVPAFHQTVFGEPGQAVAVLNIGGMANLTALSPALSAGVTGFDCGPGNALMDAWCLRHRGLPFDAAGAWAATGQVQADLLKAMLAAPFFALPPPKSTGRDLFSPAWLEQQLGNFAELAPADVQATLTELTAKACADSFRDYGSNSQRLIVCGGGAFNTHLMARLQTLLPDVLVTRSDDHGLPAQQVEATAFAWLARKMIRREALSLQSITGTRGARVLGAFYPA